MPTLSARRLMSIWPSGEYLNGLGGGRTLGVQIGMCDGIAPDRSTANAKAWLVGGQANV